jgi:beta-fructofuranosidase
MLITPEEALKRRQQFANDPHRPTYHYLPPANWMNDPNGVIQWDGRYHLFYQHNPNAPIHRDMHWGHAVSDDLLHWTDLPVALAPTPGGPDETGCFSGCAVNNDGVPTLVYTGVRGQAHDIQTQCIATSRDNLLTWDKYPGNPVIRAVPPEAGQTRDFRDPFVWREGATWYLLLASRIVDVGGVVFLYRSPDLIHWEYMHPLLSGTNEKNGRTWECPNFFPLGDKWVLILSAHIGMKTGLVFYFVGDYHNQRFTPEIEGVFDHACLYAPLTMQDDQGRRLLWGWLREGRSVEAQVAAGWSGVQSIPRVLSLLPDGRLGMEPVPELSALRGAHRHYADISLSEPAGDFPLEPDGRALEIEATFDPGQNGILGLSLLAAPDGSEQTRVIYNPQAQQLIVDREHASHDDSVEKHANTAPHTLAPGEPLQLRILLDGSVLEVIANQRTSITSRVYPTRADSTGLKLVAEGSDGKLQTLDVWAMQSIWPV